MKGSDPKTLGHNSCFFYFCEGHYGTIIMARPVSITKDRIPAGALDIVRAFLMVIRAGADDREKYIPGAGAGPGGDVDSYAILHTLTGQNYLLQELRTTPLFIQDD